MNVITSREEPDPVDVFLGAGLGEPGEVENDQAKYDIDTTENVL